MKGTPTIILGCAGRDRGEALLFCRRLSGDKTQTQDVIPASARVPDPCVCDLAAADEVGVVGWVRTPEGEGGVRG